MLEGKIIYLDKKTNKKYTYDVIGKDILNSIELNIHSSFRNEMEFLYCGDNTCPNNTRVSVQLSKILVSSIVSAQIIDGKNKKITKPVNNDFFCRLGALLRFAKSQCTTSNLDSYMALQLASGEFNIQTTKEFHIPFPKDNSRTFADVKTHYDEITSIVLNTDDFSINLNNTAADTKMETLKANMGVSVGFKLDSEYLGFEAPTLNMYDEKASSNATANVELHTCIEDIIAAHPNKEFRWLLHKDYKIVDDEHLEEICNYIMNWDGYVYYDTETSGLDINFMSRTGKADQLVGVVLSVKYGESFFFPTQMKSIPNLCNGDHFYFMEHYMKPILETKDLVAHNLPFDWKVAYIYEINAHIVHDTMTMIKLTFGTQNPNYSEALKYNAKVLLGRDSLELSDLLKDARWGKNTNIRFWDLPYELVRLYACADTDNTNGLLQYFIQNDVLKKFNAEKIYEIELNFSYAVAYQEFFGHLIDVNQSNHIKEDVHTQLKQLQEEMEKIVGYKFNPNSSVQLRDIMYKQLGIPTQVDRQTGKATTDKNALKYLAEITDAEDNAMYPFCVLMLKYRELEGIRKVVDKLPEYMHDGYIFSGVNQLGASTGRVSIKDPNYQSYNDTIKKNVIPRPGYYMFDTDYSSIEYRVLGNMAGNKRIMESFKDPDFDYHQYQAAHIYGVAYNKVTKKMRKTAKSMNFGIPYGMGDQSLGVRIFGVESEDNTRKAAKIKENYYKGQEDIKNFFEEHRDKGVALGYTETFYGRRRYYDKTKTKVPEIRRQAGNHVIQGTAADLYKMAVGNVFKRLVSEGWLGKVLLVGFIHDELLGEVSNDINPAIFLKVLREEFEVKVYSDDGTPWCPLYMGFGYGTSWYEAKSVEWPIKYQWEVVEKYGETGFSDWHQNGREFCDTIPSKLRDFEIRDIANQMLDAEAQGKEIKLTLNKQILDCLGEDKKIYDKATPNLENLLETLQKNHIACALYDKDNQILSTFEVPKDTQEAITLWCKLHNVDRSKIDLLNISDDDSTSSSLLEEEKAIDENDPTIILVNTIRNMGRSLDITNKTIYLAYPTMSLLREIEKYTTQVQDINSFSLLFVDTEGLANPNLKDQVYATGLFIPYNCIDYICGLVSLWVNMGCPKEEDTETFYNKYGYYLDFEHLAVVFKYFETTDNYYMLWLKNTVCSQNSENAFHAYFREDKKGQAPRLYDFNAYLPETKLQFNVNRYCIPEVDNALRPRQ